MYVKYVKYVVKLYVKYVKFVVKLYLQSYNSYSRTQLSGCKMRWIALTSLIFNYLRTIYS